MVAARRNKRSGGFTLIELLVALALSMVGLLGLVALQLIALRGNMMSRNFSEAIGIAQQRLELAQATPYANLPTLIEGGCVGYTSQAPAPNPNCNNAPTTTVSPDPATPLRRRSTRAAPAVTVDGVNNVTSVQVSVCWSDENTSVNNVRTHAITLYDQRSP